MYRQFNIQQYYVLATLFMCFVWISEEKAIIPSTALKHLTLCFLFLTLIQTLKNKNI